ncbi:MAG: hypothetical protein HFJ48_04800 [Clostridia bacterium]|nr:hypothetical protein [Clostridia bacterium]
MHVNVGEKTITYHHGIFFKHAELIGADEIVYYKKTVRPLQQKLDLADFRIVTYKSYDFSSVIDSEEAFQMITKVATSCNDPKPQEVQNTQNVLSEHNYSKSLHNVISLLVLLFFLIVSYFIVDFLLIGKQEVLIQLAEGKTAHDTSSQLILFLYFGISPCISLSL